MQPRILTTDIFFRDFNFQEQNTACGIEQEPNSGENYFFAQTYLPKDFFGYQPRPRSTFYDPLFSSQPENIPDRILIKFELFGIGTMDDYQAFIFKPWVINIDNPQLYNILESFHLFVPSVLFFNLIERLVFMEQLNRDHFKYIRILQDIPAISFQRFGLDQEHIKNTFETSNLNISRIADPNVEEIAKFYSQNWNGLTETLKNKYFRPLLNTWFSVKEKSQDRTIGFIRLYNTTTSFSGGTSIEYIIDKAYRGNGFATESCQAIINYLIKDSYAISLGAEVDDSNTSSVRVLEKLGFLETKSSHPLNKENYHLPLWDWLKGVEEQFDNHELKLSILNRYKDRYNRYF